MPSIISTDASITGNIVADDDIQVEGKVSVVVSKTGHIEGDIHHDSVSIEPGARVEGQLIRREAKAAQLNLVADQTTS